MTIYTGGVRVRVGWRLARQWPGTIRAARRRYVHGRAVVGPITVARW